MNRWQLFTLALACGAISACGGPAPCKQCPVVAGRYGEASSGAGVNCGGGRTLNYLGGVAGEFMLEQTASELTVKGYFDIKGTLHDDQSVTFKPFPAIAIVNDPRSGGGDDSPGSVTLEGKFTSISPPVFEGKYVFTAFIDSCRLEGPTKWTFAPR